MADESLKMKVGRPLGQVVSGCFVLTARDGAGSTGLLASWAQQAGFEPPAVTVAVKKGRPIERLIQNSRQFVLNVIGDPPAEMFKHFGKGVDAGQPAFEGLQTREVPEGIVLDACIGHLCCRVINRTDTPDHVIYVGEVVGGESHGDRKPYVHVRSSGFSY